MFFLNKDLEKKAWQPPTTDQKIIEAIKNPPTTPDETLFSRRRQSVAIRGDALVFPLESDTTSPKFVAIIKQFQQTIFNLIEHDLNLVGKKWRDKETRHKEKSYKRHKKLHLAFMGTSPPCSVIEYREKKREHTPEKIHMAKQVLWDFLNQAEEICGSVKECKINPDGHIVVRVDIHAAQALFNCKDKLGKIFGGNYNRYDDPEKQKTLAAVIGVVDPEKLSVSAVKKLKLLVMELESALKIIGSIPLRGIEWIEYDKRTLSPKSRLSVIKFQRKQPQCHSIYVEPITVNKSELKKSTITFSAKSYVSSAPIFFILTTNPSFPVLPLFNVIVPEFHTPLLRTITISSNSYSFGYHSPDVGRRQGQVPGADETAGKADLIASSSLRLGSQ